MITAKASSDALVKRLQQRGSLIARRYVERLGGRRSRAQVDWHSPRSLWPDFTRG